MSLIIDLVKECGEFCTERSHPKLGWIRSQIENAIQTKALIQFNRAGIKILTPSFIDEMISELAVKYGIQAVKQYATFNPPLEAIYEAQIDRGMRMRKKS